MYGDMEQRLEITGGSQGFDTARRVMQPDASAQLGVDRLLISGTPPCHLVVTGYQDAILANR